MKIKSVLYREVLLSFQRLHNNIINTCFSIDNSTCVSSSSVISADIVHQRALNITDVTNPSSLQSGRQYVYPDIMFSCNGTITKWIYGGEESSGTVQPELQIWHQTGPDTYIKQGFSSVTAN